MSRENASLVVESFRFAAVASVDRSPVQSGAGAKGHFGFRGVGLVDMQVLLVDGKWPNSDRPVFESDVKNAPLLSLTQLPPLNLPG
jgi:hypothetical protein